MFGSVKVHADLWLSSLPVDNSFVGQGRSYVEFVEAGAIMGFALPKIEKNVLVGIGSPDQLKTTWRIEKREKKKGFELMYVRSGDEEFVIVIKDKSLILYDATGKAKGHYFKIKDLAASKAYIQSDLLIKAQIGN